MPSVMSARRPAALMRGPSAKPKSKPQARRASRPAAANSAATPGCMRPARMRFRPCATRRRLLASSFTTSATVPSATRSSSASSRGWLSAREAAARAQLGARGEQHVEHHADAGQGLALEGAARLVRVDDHVRVGQHDRVAGERGQVMVGDDHVEPERARMRHAVEAGDAVVDRDEHARAARRAPGRRSPASGRSRAARDPAPRSAGRAGAAPSSARPRSATAQAVAPSQS